MSLFQRKYEHSYKGNVIKENLTNAVGLSIESMNRILIAKNNKQNCCTISVLDNKTYQEQSGNAFNDTNLRKSMFSKNESITLDFEGKKTKR